MDTVYKSLSVKELTSEGQIEAVISTFGRDRDGDVMTRDAFNDSDGKSIPMVWSHNWDMPIGKGVVSVGDNGAKFSGQFFLETRDGEDAYKRVKAMGDLQEYSIGFRIKDATLGYEEDEAGDRVYTRTIKDLELFEASPVLVGAAYGTRTLAVKTAADGDPIEKALADIAAEMKAGRALSPSNLKMIHSLAATAKAVHDGACDLGDDCPIAVKAASNDDMGYSSPERQEKLRELEKVLGYRPLIAGAAKT